MARIAKAWPIFASHALMLLAFPPFNLGLLVLVAMVPWFISLSQTDTKGALRSGLLFGALFYPLQMQWLIPMVQKWTGSWALGLVPVALVSLLGMAYGILLALGIHACYKRGWPWAVPLVWAGWEVFRAVIPGLAFPWGLLATPLWPYPSFIQSAFFGTIYFVSGWAALINVAVAQWMLGDRLMKLRPYILVGGLVLISSMLRFGSAIEGERKIFTIGQVGFNLGFTQQQERDVKLSKIVPDFQAAATLQKSDLLVLPEGIINTSAAIPPRIPFTAEPAVPMLFGGQRGDGPFYQSAFGWDGKWSFVDKSRLVVFGEYVPCRGFPLVDAFQLPTGDLTPGDAVKTLTINNMKIGPIICFEGLFWDVADQQAHNGAQLLAHISVDDWFIGSNAPDQLRALSVWRAVETGLPLVRVSGLGYSMAVTAHGQVVVEAPLEKEVAMRADLVLPQSAPSSPTKPFIFWGLLILGIGLPIAAKFKREKSKA